MDKEKWLLEKFYEHISDNKKDKFDEYVKNRTRHITVVLENIFQPRFFYWTCSAIKAR